MEEKERKEGEGETERQRGREGSTVECVSDRRHDRRVSLPALPSSCAKPLLILRPTVLEGRNRSHPMGFECACMHACMHVRLVFNLSLETKHNETFFLWSRKYMSWVRSLSSRLL